MIRMENVSSGYSGKQVLQQLNITVAPGEFVGIIGPNGSGKTTFIRTVTGLMSSSGHIEIAGNSLRTLSPVQIARSIATVQQQFTEGMDMRVDSLVLMGRYPHLSPLGGYTDEDHAVAHEAMAQTDTLPFARRRAGELSGGELQRVILARALAQQASILLLDEAASGMDMRRKIETFDLLSRKNGEGITIMAVIHDLNLAALYCRRLVLFDEGRIVCDGPVDEVLTAKNLADVYGTTVIISKHPVTGTPQAFYLPSIAGDSCSSTS